MAIETTWRLLAGVIILIVGIVLANSIFSQPQCDGMAENTIQQLAAAINEAPNLPVSSTKPGLEETTKYIPVPVRMCQRENALSALTVAWSGWMPEYQIFYEEFPDAPSFAFAMWTESYPWSGGLAQTFIFYGALKTIPAVAKYRTKIITLPFKYGKKGLTKLAQLFKKTVNVARSKSSRSILVALFDSKDGFVRNLLEPAFQRNPRLKYFAMEIIDGSGVRVEKIVSGELDNVNKIISKAGKEVLDGNGKLIYSRANKDMFRQLNEVLDGIPRKDAALARELYGIPKSLRWADFKDWLKFTAPKGWNFKKWVGSGFRKSYTAVKDAKSSARSWYWRLKTAGRAGVDPKGTKRFGTSLLADMKRTPQKYAKEWGVNTLEVYKRIDSWEKWFKSNDFIMSIPSDSMLYKYNKVQSDFFEDFRWQLYLEDPANKKWSSLPKPFRDNFEAYLEETGLSKTDGERFWQIMHNGFHNRNGAGLGREGAEGALNALQHNYLKRMKKEAGEMERWLDLGKVERRPIVNAIGQTIGYDLKRAKRFFFYDAAKFGNVPFNFPWWYGGGQTQDAEEALTENMEQDPTNSLILVKGGGRIESVIPLSPEVASKGGVAIWRPSPGLSRIPVFLQTILFRASVPANPRYYTVSPCFGIAKVWRGDDRIYVSIEGDIEEGEEKCSVDGNCPNMNSYCYADNDRIYGVGWETGANDLWEELGASIGTFAAVYAPCMISGAEPVCRLAGSLAAQAVFIADSGYQSSRSACEATWGYWQYYKAGDYCDIWNLVGSVKGGTKAASSLTKFAQKHGGDLCMIPSSLGDIVLSWPNIGYVKEGLNHTEIQNNQGQCVFGGPT